MQFVNHAVWIRPFNVEYFVGVDGLSISMVLLTGLIFFVAAIASVPWWQGGEKAIGLAGMDEDDHGHGDDEHHPHFSKRMVPGYMILFLLLETGMMGIFVALDFFLFYVFWEVMLLPMYFLIGIWGGPRSEYAAIKFFLYTLAGSVLMLLAMIALYYRSRPAVLADGTMSAKHTFNLLELAAQGRAGSSPRPDHPGRRLHQDRLRGLLHRLRHQDPDVPVPHLAARRPRRGADRHLGHPGRRPAEDGHLRHPALQLPDPARRDRSGRPTPSPCSA